jgi:hypothetical protein
MLGSSSKKTEGDDKMRDLQERRTPDRYSTGNCISGPAVMGWNFKSGVDYIRTERKRSSQSSVLGIYHKEPPLCDLSDLYVIKPVFSTDVG